MVQGWALVGAQALAVTIETHLANGLPAFNLVGLPEAEVKESRDRVRAALLTAGYEMPSRRITVNLAPADLPKGSGGFDLPIAISLLAASGQLNAPELASFSLVGELGLTGVLRAVRGVLPMAVAAATLGVRLIVPSASAAEASVVQASQVLHADSLLDVCAFLAGKRELPAACASEIVPTTPYYPDLSDVRGQSVARRVLEIAAAGGHSLLMVGPPGTGKSMLAARLPSVLPRLNDAEALEAAAVQSLGERAFDPALFGVPPFRSPHHSASAPALVGGGSDPRPGEISLAHHGVLFLDELPEFAPKVLESLREPMESGIVHIVRAGRRASFPARFQLVAAMNPCPCGYLGHPSARCRCSPEQVARYRGRISGPLLDRIDLLIEVPSVAVATLRDAPLGESSAQVCLRVEAVRQRQLLRQGIQNAQLAGSLLDQHVRLEPHAQALLDQSVQRLNLSARGYHRILRLTRTLADMADVTQPSAEHVAEAIHYRRGF